MGLYGDDGTLNPKPFFAACIPRALGDVRYTFVCADFASSSDLLGRPITCWGFVGSNIV